MERIDIYPGRERWDDASLKKFKEDSLSQRNKEFIREFQNHLYVTGTTKKRRVVKLTMHLCRIGHDLGIDFDKITKKDAVKLISTYNQKGGLKSDGVRRHGQDCSEATKSDYRRTFKQFYTWFEEEDERLKRNDPVAVEFYRFIKKPGNISTSYKDKQIDFGEIITEDDLALLLEKGASNSKERAFLAVLHEGMFRIGEMLQLRLCDIEPSANSILLSVDGKTGKRLVPIAWAMGRLTRWLEDHPRKSDPSAPLWTSDNSCRMHEPLLYSGAYKLVHRCYKRSGLKKKHNLHWFRHSRTSIYTAAGMNEGTLKVLGGWSAGSRHLKVYQHLNSKNVQDAVLKINGLLPTADARKLPVKCQNCQLPNDPGARYCVRCGRALSVTIAFEDEGRKNTAIEEAMQEYARIIADPDLSARFVAFCKEFRREKGGDTV